MEIKMKMPPREKTFNQKGYVFEEHTLYMVEVSYNKGNPIHNCLLWVGFLEREGGPGAYSKLINPVSGEVRTIRQPHYMEVVKKLEYSDSYLGERGIYGKKKETI
jgi:hypothetical protein